MPNVSLSVRVVANYFTPRAGTDCRQARNACREWPTSSSRPPARARGRPWNGRCNTGNGPTFQGGPSRSPAGSGSDPLSRSCVRLYGPARQVRVTIDRTSAASRFSSETPPPPPPPPLAEVINTMAVTQSPRCATHLSHQCHCARAGRAARSLFDARALQFRCPWAYRTLSQSRPSTSSGYPLIGAGSASHLNGLADVPPTSRRRRRRGSGPVHYKLLRHCEAIARRRRTVEESAQRSLGLRHVRSCFCDAVLPRPSCTVSIAAFLA